MGARRVWLERVWLPIVTLLWFILPTSHGFTTQWSFDRHHCFANTRCYVMPDALVHDDLTKEELALRFTEVLDYYNKTDEMSQENVRLNMLRTRLDDLHLNRCFVAQSSIKKAGLGLFASRDIASGELITLFPGDALLVWNKEVGDFRSGFGVLFGNHVDAEDRDANRVSSDEARLYELKIRTSHSIVADPLLVNDAAYLGHMSNDGSALMNKSNDARTKYSKATYDRHNAAFFDMEGCHYTTLATRDIQKGQEIFVSYGEAYWLSRLKKKKSGRKSEKTARRNSQRGFGSG